MPRQTMIAPTMREKTSSDLGSFPAGEQADVTLHLLLQLRAANRSILRLREVALAARDGDAERLRAALAKLDAVDLAWSPPGRARGHRR